MSSVKIESLLDEKQYVNVLHFLVFLFAFFVLISFLSGPLSLAYPCIHLHLLFSGEQGWHSGKSTRLPPIWPAFEFWRRRHMWVEFVVGSLLCSARFFSGYSGFPLSLKTNTSKFQFDLKRSDTFQRVLKNS